MSSVFTSDTGWTLDVSAPPINVTSSGPKRDLKWSETDSNGHVHTYETDSWHEVLDDPDGGWFYFDADGEEYNSPSHYECKLCGDHVTPGVTWAHAGWEEYMPGPITATLTGRRSDGATITATLAGDEFARIRTADQPETRDVVVQTILDDMPTERITAMTGTFG